MGGILVTALIGAAIARSSLQAPAIRAVDEKALREYAGVYRWGPDSFVYLQLWHEFSGFGKPGQLVASMNRARSACSIQPTAIGSSQVPGAAVPSSVESRIEFQRDGAGRITSLTWTPDGGAARTAPRVELEKHEDVRFASGDVQLAGTLLAPSTAGKHPAIILVHGSGAENREFILPFARFLVRRGMAVLGYDKRGVGGSTGDWQTALVRSARRRRRGGVRVPEDPHRYRRRHRSDCWG